MTKTLIATIGLAVGLTTPAFAAIDWSFTSNPDPLGTASSPVLVSPDGSGSGSANLYKGAGAGWVGGGLNTTTPPMSPTGYWDLGQNGSIVLTPPSGSQISSVTVLLYVDTDVFRPVTISAGSLATTILSTGDPVGSFGGQWQQLVWTFSSPLSSVTINAPSGSFVGSAVDQISIETTATVVPEPSTLIAGALLLLPFGLSTLRVLRRK